MTTVQKPIKPDLPVLGIDDPFTIDLDWKVSTLTFGITDSARYGPLALFASVNVNVMLSPHPGCNFITIAPGFIPDDPAMESMNCEVTVMQGKYVNSNDGYTTVLFLKDPKSTVVGPNESVEHEYPAGSDGFYAMMEDIEKFLLTKLLPGQLYPIDDSEETTGE